MSLTKNSDDHNELDLSIFLFISLHNVGANPTAKSPRDSNSHD